LYGLFIIAIITSIVVNYYQSNKDHFEDWQTRK
jgi:hypothetical protein